MSNAHVIIQNSFTRVRDWNEAGFTGQGIAVWNLEGYSEHGKMTRNRILDAAPDAKVFSRPLSFITKDGVISDDRVYDEQDKEYVSADEFVTNNDIHIMTVSKGRGKPLAAKSVEWFCQLRDRHHIVCFNSAGNDGSRGVKSGFLPEEMAMYIGACLLYKGDPNDIRMATYSSIGDTFEKVDFSSFTSDLSGTSFATPYLAGTTALLHQRYGPMSHDEVYNYFKMIAKPIDTTAEPDVIIEFANGRYLYDMWSGYGVPILPKLSQRYITMTIGDAHYYIDGVQCSMDVKPFVKDGRTFVPVAFIAQALGADVTWNRLQKKVTVAKDGITIELYIGKNYYKVNGWQYPIDVAPFIKDDRTFVPISWVALALGCRVAWCEREKKVQILEMDRSEA